MIVLSLSDVHSLTFLLKPPRIRVRAHALERTLLSLKREYSAIVLYLSTSVLAIINDPLNALQVCSYQFCPGF